MASEIRVDKITSLSGVGTITPSPTGIEISGITTTATLRATTGIVTSLTAGSLTSLSDVKVGSGVTLSPDGDVSITGVTTFTGHIDASSDVFISDKIIHAGDTNTAIRFPSADTITAETGGTERLRITSGGLVGVSRTPTQHPLEIQHASEPTVSFWRGSTKGAAIQAQSGGTYVYSYENAPLILSVNSSNGFTERARISQNGRLLVGTTADVDNVAVSIGGSVRLVNATGQSATITALPSGTYTTGVSGGSAIVFHRFSDAGGGSDEIAFETHHQGTRHGEAARFNKSGNLVFPSGQGIDFSATSDGQSVGSELFDDYEEGSYTPVVTYSGTTYTYGASNDYTLRSPHSNANNNSIAYTKIGSMVFLNFTIFWNQSYTNRYVISLPFTARGSAYALCTTPASFQVDIDGDSLGTLGTGNNSTGFDTFRILKDTSTGGHGNVPLTASSEVYYMISYEAL